MWKVVAALMVGMAASASGQDFTMSVTNNTQFHADWQKVTQCAKKPYPKIDWKDAKLRDLGEGYFREISACRWALAERQAVWVEAGRTAESNPYPPVTMNNAEDFQREIVCDYSGLDKNGMGAIRCNADKW